MPQAILRSFALVLFAIWLVPLSAFADEDACGPEIEKKDVQVFEVDATHPASRMDALQASEGETWDVVATDEVRSTSDPVRRARIEAARRGCSILIVGEVRRVDSKTTLSMPSGRGAPRARRGWSKVANVVYAQPADDAEVAVAQTP